MREPDGQNNPFAEDLQPLMPLLASRTPRCCLRYRPRGLRQHGSALGNGICQS